MKRLIVAAIAVIAVLIVVLALSRSDSGEASKPEAKALISQVSQTLADDPRRAALTALAAERLDSGNRSAFAMLDVALAHTAAERILAAHDGPVTAAIRTKRILVTAGADRKLRVWDPKSGARLGERRVDEPIERLAASMTVAAIGSVDAQGAVALWNIGDPRAPTSHVLELEDAGTAPVVGLGFNGAGTELLVIRGDGRIDRFDSAAGTALKPVDLADATGRLPWRGGDKIELAAVRLLTDDFSGASTLVAGTVAGEVVRIDLRALSGRTAIEADEIPGRIVSIATQAYGEPSIVVGATGGLLRWDDSEDSAKRDRGLAVSGVAFGEDNLWIGDTQGLSAIPTSEEFRNREPGAGRPATAVVAGPGGVVVTHADGTVTLLAERPAGLVLDKGLNSTVAIFGPDGDLLTAVGDAPRQIEALVAIDPGVPGRDEYGSPVAHRTVRRYLPAASWWPAGDDDEKGWYVNSAAVGERLVVAGGQDPPGNAVVLVWDRRSGRPLRRLPLTSGGGESSVPAIATAVAILDKKELVAAYSILQESIVLWSTDSWRQVATIDVGPAAGFSVSPDEETIVVPGLSDEQAETHAGNAQSHIVFVDVDEHEIDHEVVTGTSHRADISPDGDTIATLSDGGQLRFLTGDGRSQVRRPVQLQTDYPIDLAWRPDAKVLAVSLGESIVLVDPSDGKVSKSVPIPEDDANAISLSWSDDGSMLAATLRTEDDEGASRAPAPAIFRFDQLRSRMCAVAGGAPTAADWRRWSPDLAPPAGVCPTPRAATAPDARPVAQAAVAYQSGERLLVAGIDGTAFAIGSASEVYPGVPFVWSKAGALAWTADGAVHLLPAGETREHAWSCPCDGVTFDGGDDPVAVARDGSAVLRFAARSETPTRTAVRGLPPFGTSTQGHAGDQVVVATFETQQERATPSAFFAVDREGRVRRLAADRGGAAQVGGVSAPDGSAVAVVTSSSSGACFSPSFIGVVDVAKRAVTFPDMPGDDDDAQFVRSLRYTAKGDLYAFIAPQCRDNDVSGAPPPGELYRLDAETWVPTGKRGHDLQPGRFATAILAGNPKASNLSGRLTLRPPVGDEKLVATEARSVVVRP